MLRLPAPPALRPAWVLALFLASYLLGQLHHASERHIVCAAHGDLAHAAELAHGAPGTRARATAAPASRVTSGDVEGAHHHCPLTSFHREDLVSFEASGARPGPAVVAVGDPAHLHSACVEARRFLIAPKQSPPA